jgi:hypothetical protein
MENAKIAVFEDNTDSIDLIITTLDGSGHELVGIASNPDDAITLAKKIRAGEIIANVLLLDGNLSNIPPLDGRDVRKIMDVIGLRRSDYLIINISLSDPNDLGVVFDVDLGKDRIVPDLLEVLESH